VIGRLVRKAEQLGVPLSELDVATLRGEHPTFADDVRSVFDWRASTDARDVAGGTSKRAVCEQLDAAAARLETLGVSS
jgi:argininosuccinate lyase